MQRLFAAIEIPARIRDRLAQLRMPLPGARWIDPDKCIDCGSCASVCPTEAIIQG